MIRVAICDDHLILREGLKRMLDDSTGIRVVGEAADGSEVMQRVREGGIDVLVLDLTMPGRSGIDLIKAVKAERRELPILVLSMHKEEQYSVRALRAGASGYLTKESAAAKLVEAIRRVAQGGVYVSNNVTEHLVRGMAQGEGRAPHEELTDREYQVFDLLVDGRSVTQIAQALNLSSKTISTHKARIMEKLGSRSTADLVHYSIRHGLKEPRGA